MPRVIASIEARMGSSRLPGKVLENINDKPSLTRLLTRLRKCVYLDDIVVATSTNHQDDAIVQWAEEENVAIYRGSEDDVLQRVVNAQESMQSDIVVEITGDCPLIDPDIIDMGVSTFLNNSYDVVSNTFKPSYPMGVDVQVFHFSLLKEIEQSVMDSVVREHVSIYFYEHPERYSIIHLQAPPSLYGPTLRFQLDYPEDLQFIRTVYKELEPMFGVCFSTGDVFKLLRDKPELKTINAHLQEKPTR